MKRLGFIAGFGLLVGGGICPAAEHVLKDGDKVAIIGDSITEQKQYSVFIEEYLLACKPVQGIHTIQFGWSGEQASGFKRRMENDCFRFHPTVATTCYGMNDGHYAPQTDANAKSYHENQSAVVEAMKKAGVRAIVVGSPGCVDSYTFKHDKKDTTDRLSDGAEMYNKTLGSERDIAQTVSKEQGVLFANVFDAMVDVMGKAKAKFGNKYAVAGGDGVHPGANGQLVMAYAFLKGLGCDGNIGTITVDLAGNKAEATDGHKVLSASNGSVEIESTRYPFCVPAAVRDILPLFSFNQDLNRLTLIVKGAGTGKVKITWGLATKEFDAAALEKGINLADEFLDNPFSDAFKKVDAAVRAQQNFETGFIKQTVHSIAFPSKPAVKKGQPAPKELTPEERQKAADEGAKKQEELSEAAVKSVEPVKHTIKIEVSK